MWPPFCTACRATVPLTVAPNAGNVRVAASGLS